MLSFSPPSALELTSTSRVSVRTHRRPATSSPTLLLISRPAGPPPISYDSIRSVVLAKFSSTILQPRPSPMTLAPDILLSTSVSDGGLLYFLLLGILKQLLLLPWNTPSSGAIRPGKLPNYPQLQLITG